MNTRRACCTANGAFYGWDFPPEKGWKTVRVPVDSLKPFWGTEANPSAPPSNQGLARTVLADFRQPTEIASVRVAFEDSESTTDK